MMVLVWFMLFNATFNNISYIVAATIMSYGSATKRNTQADNLLYLQTIRYKFILSISEI